MIHSYNRLDSFSTLELTLYVFSQLKEIGIYRRILKTDTFLKYQVFQRFVKF